MIIRENRLEKFALFPFGMLRGQLVHAGECKHGLSIQRLFDPESSVLIEGGNAIFRRYIVGPGLIRHFIDEGNDRLPGWSVVPGRKSGSLSIDVSSQRQCEQHDGSASVRQLQESLMKVHMSSL